MSLTRFLNKPEYVFRPKQILKRLKRKLSPKNEEEEVITILGAPLYVKESETIGKALLHFGVYDLALTEVLWRLLEPGQKAVDVGANIGYFSVLMGYRVGSYGRVHCFEPHPYLQKKWQKSLRKWAQCQLHTVGLSSTRGEMDLYIPHDFQKNEGVASFERKPGASVIKVPVSTLDEALQGAAVDVIKIDVEGHELEVFKGAKKTLEGVSHILFEDFHGKNSPVISLLQEKGFHVLRLQKKLNGVQFIELNEMQNLPLWEPPNYLATRNYALVKDKFTVSGWKSLKFL